MRKLSKSLLALVLVSIATATSAKDGQPAAKALAEKVIDSAYGYQMCTVLYKPTLTVASQTFRTSRDCASPFFASATYTIMVA